MVLFEFLFMDPKLLSILCAKFDISENIDSWLLWILITEYWIAFYLSFMFICWILV
jgi:hypothetical protein